MPGISLRQMVKAWAEHTAKTTTLADAKAAAARGLATVKQAHAKHGFGRLFFREITKDPKGKR